MVEKSQPERKKNVLSTSQLEVKNTRVGAFLVGFVHIYGTTTFSLTSEKHISTCLLWHANAHCSTTWEFELKCGKKTSLTYYTEFCVQLERFERVREKKGIHTFAPWSKSMWLGESWQAESEEKKWDWNLKTRAMKLFDGKENDYSSFHSQPHSKQSRLTFKHSNKC